MGTPRPFGSVRKRDDADRLESNKTRSKRDAKKYLASRNPLPLVEVWDADLAEYCRQDFETLNDPVIDRMCSSLRQAEEHVQAAIDHFGKDVTFEDIGLHSFPGDESLGKLAWRLRSWRTAFGIDRRDRYAWLPAYECRSRFAAWMIMRSGEFRPTLVNRYSQKWPSPTELMALAVLGELETPTTSPKEMQARLNGWRKAVKKALEFLGRKGPVRTRSPRRYRRNT